MNTSNIDLLIEKSVKSMGFRFKFLTILVNLSTNSNEIINEYPSLNSINERIEDDDLPEIEFLKTSYDSNNDNKTCLFYYNII